jgi:hypothetical protein
MLNESTNWLNLIQPTSEYRLLAVKNRKLLKDARKYPYPMFDELKIEIKNASSITDEIGRSIVERIRDQMSLTRKDRVVVVYEVLDRLSPSKRKDRSKNTVKREGKVMVISFDDIPRAVNSFIAEINKLASTSPTDGYKVRVRLGSINTLEGFFEPGEDDVHKLTM